MFIRKYLDEALQTYSEMFERDIHVEAFQLFLAKHDNLTGRTNLAGHVTGSALVWHKATQSVFRVFHAKLKTWVYSAGGHIDDGEMPWQTSQRELGEETGMVARPLFNLENPLPLILGVHPIPASLKKNEPAYWHYDMVYLYEVDEKPSIMADPSEITEYHWVNTDQVIIENSSHNLIERLLRFKP